MTLVLGPFMLASLVEEPCGLLTEHNPAFMRFSHGDESLCFAERILIRMGRLHVVLVVCHLPRG